MGDFAAEDMDVGREVLGLCLRKGLLVREDQGDVICALRREGIERVLVRAVRPLEGEVMERIKRGPERSWGPVERESLEVDKRREVLGFARSETFTNIDNPIKVWEILVEFFTVEHFEDDVGDGVRQCVVGIGAVKSVNDQRVDVWEPSKNGAW